MPSMTTFVSLAGRQDPAAAMWALPDPWPRSMLQDVEPDVWVHHPLTPAAR